MSKSSQALCIGNSASFFGRSATDCRYCESHITHQPSPSRYLFTAQAPIRRNDRSVPFRLASFCLQYRFTSQKETQEEKVKRQSHELQQSIMTSGDDVQRPCKGAGSDDEVTVASHAAMLTKNVTLSADEAMCFSEILSKYLLLLSSMYVLRRHNSDIASLVKATGCGVFRNECYRPGAAFSVGEGQCILPLFGSVTLFGNTTIPRL